MAYTLDHARDWQYHDGVEEVTLTPNDRLPPESAVENVKAVRGAITRQDVQSIATMGIEPVNATWIIWDARAEGSDSLTTLGVEPRNGDTVEDADSVEWVIKNAQHSPAGFWRCFAQRKLT